MVRISSAGLVQENGRQRSFQAAQKCLIAATRSVTLPRRSAWRSTIEKNTSARFSYDAEVGVKWSWMRE